MGIDAAVSYGTISINTTTTPTPQEEYARLVLRHRTEGIYGRAAAAMRRGICEVLQDPRGRLLGLYTANELGTVVGGVQELDAGEWEAYAVYDGACCA